MFEIHARELRATFLRNHSVRNHSVRRHKGISKESQRKASQRKAPQRRAPHRAPSRRQLKPTKRPGHLARNHATTTRQETACPQIRDGPTYAVPGPRIGAQIRQSTPNRMRLSARRPLVAAEFGARGIPVRRAPQLYGHPPHGRTPGRRGSTHTGHVPQRNPQQRGPNHLSWPREPQR